MSERDELATLLEETDHCDGGPYRDGCLRQSDAILASDWLRRDRARVAAEALEAFAERHSGAPTWPDFEDEIARIRSDAGIDQCPGCDGEIPERYADKGVCHNCYGTTDDPHREAR